MACRTDRPLPRELKKKIALHCNLDIESVIAARDVESIYEVPLVFHEEGIDDQICKGLKLETPAPDLRKWAEVVRKIKEPENTVNIALVGKYVGLRDAYKSLMESLIHGGIANSVKVNIQWVESEDIEESGPEKYLADVDGILIPGGFGERGVEGKVDAIAYARTKKIPFLGICLGMQCAVIEFARNVCGLKGANSTEFVKDAEDPIIYLIEEWYDFRNQTVQRRDRKSDKGGTMRLGEYPCTIDKDSNAFKAYGQEEVHERHRHRYEFNNEYRAKLEQHGMKFSGMSPDKQLMEIVEIEDHPWFFGCQFHPEFKSRPLDPHPVFKAFIEAAFKEKKLLFQNPSIENMEVVNE